MKRLASVDELNSAAFRSFMTRVNAFAQEHGLRVHTDWSKVWEYPWIWQYLSSLHFPDLKILDIGSEISPMPWFFASLGAEVWMTETDSTHLPKWKELKIAHDFAVHWDLLSGPGLPMADETFDLVTSFSVIEHIEDKQSALDEALRVLKPGGLFCLTFDVCEASRGMTFPEWSGKALDLATFDQLIWSREDLQPLDPLASWNIKDMEAFREWNLQSAAHHNYVVGGAVFRKKLQDTGPPIRPGRRTIRVHQLDTGLGSGNTGDDAMFLAAQARLESEFELSTEIHSLKRTQVLPQEVRYLSVEDSGATEASIRESDMVFLIGDTPVMDQWGLAWPLLANAGKLRLCHELGKPVHALGVGVDRLQDPEGLRIFQEAYLPIASWSVRSEHCKQALLEMGVTDEKIVVGADWAWLLRPQIDSEWAGEVLQKAGASTSKLPIGVNLVNEIWKDDVEMKKAWGSLLDRLIEKYDAQVFFFCNESREGDYFDQAAAAKVRERMRHPSIMVPSHYYEPEQMISLLSCMQLTLSQRYHFTLFSVLADVYPISIHRGQKMEGLNQELDLPFVGDMTHLDEESMEREIEAVLSDAEAKMGPLRMRRKHLETRAMNNLSLVRY